MPAGYQSGWWLLAGPPPEVWIEYMGGAGALVYFRNDTPGSPKRTATDLTLGLKCEIPSFLVPLML